VATTPTALQNSFKVGDRLVSPKLNTISRNGNSSRVEPKAMQVLTCLASHPGEVISKEDLIEIVWTDSHVTDDVLTGCISALRKALDDNPRTPTFIQTIPKSGYRLIAPVLRLNGNGNSTRSDARPRKLLLLALLLVTLAAAIPLSLWYFRARKVIDSVAILPFVNSGVDSNADYLSDGITESIIDSISQLPKLRVMAWSTVTRYKGQARDPLEIGRELGVKAVFTGKIARSGNELRIQTELVDLGTGGHIWGESYTRELSDVIPLQEEIARRISEKLRLKLSGEDEQKLAKRYTADPEAYNLYLKGRYFWNKRTEDGMQKAISYFQQAIDHDPAYAVAYAGLADAYNLLDDWGSTPPSESFPKARAAALRALELDDSLAEAHTSLAFVKANYDWDFPGAEKEFQRAIALNPNYATAHQWYAMYLVPWRRFSEAKREIQRAHELDPLSLIISMGVAEVFAWEGNYDAALEQYKKTIELDSTFIGAHRNLSNIYEHNGTYREAVEELKKAAILQGELSEAAEIERTFVVKGYPALMKRNFEHDLKKKTEGKYISASGIANYYVRVGDKGQALNWLEKAYAEHDSSLAFLPVTSDFDPLKDDPRFQQLLRKVGFR
jgi:TolB-like protein/DNA-binding winged helix-turn-helix (wHTH) protein/Tfp pilus assembly protein PilF